jgi:WD40 repeat protein
MARALVPWKSDALAFGCAGSFIVLRGDPANGGYFENVDSKVGVFGQDAWCFDGTGNLYFWGTGGVYRSSRGFGTLDNLTATVYPDIIGDEEPDPSTHRITFGQDPRQNGVQISITKLSDGSNSCYWLDFKTGGFYPDVFNDDHGPYCMCYYDANDPDLKHLLVGCKDGYIRRFDPTSKNDDGLAIDSYVDYGPIQLTNNPDQEGVIFSVDAELGGGGVSGIETDSNDLVWRVWTDASADTINEKLGLNTTPNIGGIFKGPGRRRGNAIKRKVKGVYAGVKLRNNTISESWAFEKMIVGIRPAGRMK